LRDIAYGRILAQALVEFRHSAKLLSGMKRLPLPTQRELAAGGPVAVCDFNGGKVGTRLVPILELTSFEQEQVLGPNGLRTQAEQRSWLETQGKKARTRSQGDLIVDKKMRELVVVFGNTEVRISRAKMYDLLKEMDA